MRDISNAGFLNAKQIPVTILYSHRGNRNGLVCGKAFAGKIFLSLLFSILSALTFAQPYKVTIRNVMTLPPVNAIIRDYVASGRVFANLSNDTAASRIVYLLGTITRVSPQPFTISLNPNVIITPIQLAPNISLPLNPTQLLTAFGNFDLANLNISGIDPVSLTDPNNPKNIKLPDGNYTLCLYGRSDIQCSANCALSDPNLGCSMQFSIVSCSQPANAVRINTTVSLGINPLIAQTISAAAIRATLQFTNPPGCNAQVKLFGKIERIAPSPFSISLSPNYQQQPPISLLAGGPIQLTPIQQASAFGNFSEVNLVAEGIDFASIRDANNNIKLPNGNYRICFYARYFNPTGGIGDNASDPSLGCATFNICSKAEGAPQFTAPINNMNINSAIAIVQPASPITFMWTPPQSTCGLPPGGLTYDFEIRELFNNQNVNDALNNPYVFRKTLVPSTTFLLDTNLYKGVLQTGKRYAVRVRAVPTITTSGFEIDNGGYSRIEAFQYGGNVITQNGMPDPQDYYIQFEDRKCGYWSDVFDAYKRHTRGDTLVPIREYIAFALTENGTAYNVDAIDLFLALNPDLAELKKVKIGYAPKLPEFPRVPSNDQKSFGKHHMINLEPDNIEKSKFLKYLDTLNLTKTKISGDAGKMVNDLAGYLNGIKPQVDSIDRVTVNLVNSVMSELLYELRQNSKGFNKAQYNQLQNLNTALHELTAFSPYSTSFLYPLYTEKQSLSSYLSSSTESRKKISLLNYPLKPGEADDLKRVLAAIMKQLLSYDVIVFRSGAVAPYKPVLDAPDLTATYRIFYTLSILYNHKNPDINAKSTGHLASTVQISLPSNSDFTFWTLNMINHKMTKAVDVDLKNVLSEMQKASMQSKKLSIVLKVE